MEIAKARKNKRKTAVATEGAFVRVALGMSSVIDRNLFADKPSLSSVATAQLKPKKTRKTPEPWTQVVNLVLIRHLYVPKHMPFIF